MIFPGFPSIENNSGVSNASTNPRLGGAGDASFAEIALGLIESIAPPSASPAGPVVTAPASATPADNKAGVSAALIANAAVNPGRVDHSVARAPVSATPSATAGASVAVVNSNAAAGPVTPTPGAAAPVAPNQLRPQSIFSCVLT